MTDAETVPWRLPGRTHNRRPPASPTWLRDRIVAAPQDVMSDVVLQGLTTLVTVTIDPDMCLRSQQLIEQCGALADVVRGAIQEIHLLDAKPGYDVSHSEPCWLHRVFVSVPDRHDEIGALRFAEGVIHEAMHLELTLLENDRPLVQSPADTMLSPWREEARPIGGVLHGLFVFSCLHTAFRMLVSGTDAAATDHVQGRLHDIAEEVSSIDLATLSSGLTPTGCTLARQWSEAVTLSRLPQPNRKSKLLHQGIGTETVDLSPLWAPSLHQIFASGSR
ncbi:HEXXH motif-containing putative peptide modification protein [Sphingobium sp. BS19]|uniref:aKG-HExxH-type peptide beta-hydroxylase n=1 Tax=Sphingobium sp. BS19 TaxID=3018973 RepID=UPI0024915D9A|nr:HEXXH motif-containing putative peptide modification protein [Sphingobium sp. BS19]